MDENTLRAIVDQEIFTAIGYVGGEMSKQRMDAMDRYNGKPLGNEVEGRSKFVTTEVRDVIEDILPHLLRVFLSGDAVEFEPFGEEDEEQALQETDYVNYVFEQENNGFLTLYTLFKDALLSKTGVAKVHWDERTRREREEYDNLTDEELGFLLSEIEQEGEADIKEQEYNEDGTWHIKLDRVIDESKACVTPIPPENFLISKDSTSVYPDQARFCAHRERVTASDLIEMGYSKSLVSELSSDEGWVYNEERLARRDIEDEVPETEISALDDSQRQIWYHECYIRVDFDGDGVSELRRVVRCADRILENEVVDSNPFIAITPFIITHKFHGDSVADCLMELGKIKTAVLRNIIDNFYLANNQEKVVNERCHIEDFLVSRPGGLKRVEGDAPVQNAVMELNVRPLGPEGYQLLEYLDSVADDRIAGPKALDPNVLQNANVGAVAMSYEASQAKVEGIIRVFAETGIKDLFRKLHELLIKHQNKQKVLKLRGKWVPVDPSEWRHRRNMTVNVGLGNGSKDQRRLAAQSILDAQQRVIEGGGLGTLITTDRVFNGLETFVESVGFKNVEKYFLNPNSPEGQQLAASQRPEPNPQQEALQATMQIEMAKIQQRSQEGQMKAQMDMQNLQLKMQEQAQKFQQWQEEMALKIEKMYKDSAAKATEQELKYGQDVPGATV